MKTINSKLFEKFEDLKIVNESFKKIVGGSGLTTPIGLEESNATGDTQSTQNGCDCGDNSQSTDLFIDSIFTKCGQDN